MDYVPERRNRMVMERIKFFSDNVTERRRNVRAVKEWVERSGWTVNNWRGLEGWEDWGVFRSVRIDSVGLLYSFILAAQAGGAVTRDYCTANRANCVLYKTCNRPIRLNQGFSRRYNKVFHEPWKCTWSRMIGTGVSPEFVIIASHQPCIHDLHSCIRPSVSLGRNQ